MKSLIEQIKDLKANNAEEYKMLLTIALAMAGHINKLLDETTERLEECETELESYR